MLAVRDVRVRLAGQTLLDVPDLRVMRGETLAIMGPNGAGKSTLLQVVALLLRPQSGSVLLAGEPASPANELRLRRRLAVVFQEPLLLDTTVAENVATGLRLRGVAAQQRKRRVADWLTRFGIAHLACRRARTLSGGEAQRTSLARAFAIEPELLLLDEPFAALDPQTRFSLLVALQQTLRETGVTAVLVTHDRNEALMFGQRVAVMLDGCIAQVGEPVAVFRRPASAAVAAFVGVDNVLPGVVRRRDGGLLYITLGGHTIAVVADHPVGQKVIVCLRPEDITVGPAGERDKPTSARNTLRGTVVTVTPLGAVARIALDCGVPLVAVVTLQSLQELDFQPGTPVYATFKATAAHTLPGR